MKKLFIVLCLSLGLFALSCINTPKIVTYQDAEDAFVSSLTQSDTLTVLALGQEFMSSLVSGDLDGALSLLSFIDGNVLFPSVPQYSEMIRPRFESYPVRKYEFVRLSFSTEGINDLCYRYSLTDAEDAPGMKLVFNPVKIDGEWYLTLKDGYQSSKDLAAENQVNPNVPAPEPIVLYQPSAE